MEQERLDIRPRGRPRSEQAHSAILEATIEVAREVGYDALTMDAVAARAGVGKATVYRRWPSKEFLVAEAVEQLIRSFDVPDSGSLKKDLDALIDDLLGMYEDPQSAAMLSSLIAAMARSEAIAAAVRGGFVNARREALSAVFRAAVRRGELRRSVDVELAVDLISAPLFYRFLVTGERIDKAYTKRMVDTLLRGLK